MKANEFRIGNLAKYKDQILRIDNLVKGEVWNICRGDKIELIPLVNIKPIRLSPEILEKCGVKRYDECRWEFAQGYIVKHANGYFYHYYDPCVIVDYLHQLQNLYFVLTGQELEIKL